MKGWRPLGVLLLVAALAWFALGPLRTSGIGSSTARPEWGSASPRATSPPTSAARATRGGSAADAAARESGSRTPAGGLFGVVDKAQRRDAPTRGARARSAAPDDGESAARLRSALARLGADRQSAPHRSGSSSGSGTQQTSVDARGDRRSADPRPTGGSRADPRGMAAALAFVLVLAYFVRAGRRR